MSATFTVRRAAARDQPAITTLVRNEHLNPIDLDWRRFVIATDRSGVLGAVQLRKHADHSRELGSLVVRRDARGRGIAARLIDRLLAPIATRVLMITGAAFAAHYERWGFRPIDPDKAPAAVRRNYYFGKIVGGAISLLSGRQPRRLAILDRNPRVG
jgi:N-acetylglutamate synthase-like GNAT family acetyltransferase